MATYQAYFYFEPGSYLAPAPEAVCFCFGPAAWPNYPLHLVGFETGFTDLELGGIELGYQATVGAKLGRVRAGVILGSMESVTVAAKCGRPRALVDTLYDPNLLSHMVSERHIGLLRGAPTQSGAPVAVRAGIRQSGGAPNAWRRALAESQSGRAQWTYWAPVAADGMDQWRGAELTTRSDGDRWQSHFVTPSGRATAWGNGASLPQSIGDRWHQNLPPWAPGGDCHPGRNGGQGRLSWRRPSHQAHDAPAAWHDGLRLPAATLPKWRDAGLLLYVRRVYVPPVEPPPPWEHWGNNLCLVQPLGLPLDLGWYGCRDWRQNRIPRRRVYFVLHDLALYRLSDSLPIDCESLTISLDADAWAWSWSGRLLGRAALDAVLPSLDGEPVTLVAAVDGYLWHLLVEDWSEDRELGRRGITASGRGLTAWLAAPYQLPASGTLANDRTIQQAMAELLPVDWTLTWQAAAPDWLLPAGAWSWQRTTPIQAIHAAAQEVGAIVIPGQTSRTLHVQPRYPILPWDFAGAVPDLVVPDSAILSISRRRRVESQANAVYVHGGEVGGVLARVYRTGSAGDRLAETQSSPLITHADGARQLGSRILAAQERQPEVRSIRLPVGGDFLLGSIGQLLEIEDGSETVRGIINGVNLEVAGGAQASVRQTLTIGEETPNAWARFARLLPEDPLLAGEVAIVHAGGTLSVDLIGGGRVRVRGAAALGAMVYVRGGQVVGEAPQMSGIEIDV